MNLYTFLFQSSRHLVRQTYSHQKLGSMVENICGQDGTDAWIDDANDPEPEFLEDSNEEDGDKNDSNEDDGNNEDDDLEDGDDKHSC